MSKPHINVTPLIDVLLVLLIIFMVVTPMKPSALKAKVPGEPADKPVKPHPLTLIVTVGPDSTITLLPEGKTATVQNPTPIIDELRRTFDARTRNMAFTEASVGDSARVEKTVFIKAPRQLDYGTVARVIDIVKTAGADPVSLQLDDLE